MGRGNSGIGNGGGSGKVSVSAATKTLNAQYRLAFVNGEPPKTIKINGVEMKGGLVNSFKSNGGFTVRSYKYTAENQIVDDGRNSITFLATDYLTEAGKKAEYFERDKPKVYNVTITGAVAYSTGRSGGI